MKKKTILTSAGYVTIRLSRQVWRFSLLRSFILAMLCAVILMGCSTDNDDNPAVRPEYTGVPLIILDTDIGSSFGYSPEPDYNFLQSMSFAKTFFRLWPSDVDIIFDPMETGNSRFQMPGDDAWNSAMLEKIRDVNKIR